MYCCQRAWEMFCFVRTNAHTRTHTPVVSGDELVRVTTVRCRSDAAMRCDIENAHDSPKCQTDGFRREKRAKRPPIAFKLTREMKRNRLWNFHVYSRFFDICATKMIVTCAPTRKAFIQNKIVILQGPNSHIVDEQRCISRQILFEIPCRQPAVSCIPEVGDSCWRRILPRFATGNGYIIVRKDFIAAGRQMQRDEKLLIERCHIAGQSPRVRCIWCGQIETAATPKTTSSLNCAGLHVVHAKYDFLCGKWHQTERWVRGKWKLWHSSVRTWRPFHLVTVEIIVESVAWFWVARKLCRLPCVQCGVWSEVKHRIDLFAANVHAVLDNFTIAFRLNQFNFAGCWPRAVHIILGHKRYCRW